jgi:hypothetical protein
MAAGDATAADVPGKYDVVLGGKGYVLADSVEPSLPFRSHRAIYDITPTFVQRSNVSNSYGDNAQDFFLTARQRDWSLGEQQKFFRNGQDGRYWMGQNVNVSTPGQVNLSPALTLSSALAESVVSGCRTRSAVSSVNLVGATHLYQIAPDGTSIDEGAHGLGAIPAPFGACTDGINTYISTAAAGTVGVRRWDTSSFTTFSATAADSLAFVNNTLFGLVGYNGNTTTLIQYDTAGTATTLFTWKLATGTSFNGAPSMAKIEAFGGKVLILLAYGQDAGAELWIYDGSGASRLEVFPTNFVAYDLEILYGVAYVSGSFIKPASPTTVYTRPAIHFFDGSQVGLLWQANAYGTFSIPTTNVVGVGPHPTLTMYEGSLVFNDDTTGNLMLYSPSRGGVSSIATYTVSGDTPRLVSSGTSFFLTRNQTTYRFFPATTYPSSGYVISSLIDFESSLMKQFRGVKVDFDSASDGDGGSVDIAYQVDSISGSWTTLKTGAASGTEYEFTNISGHSIAIRVTINKGTSTAGPTLKNMNVRAAPILRQFRSGLYVIDCTGSPDAPRELRDGTYHPLAPFDQVKNLLALAQTTTPFLVTDRLGTFTALVDLNDAEGFDIYEEHPAPDNPEKSGSYLARVKVREV